MSIYFKLDETAYTITTAH